MWNLSYKDFWFTMHKWGEDSTMYLAEPQYQMCTTIDIFVSAHQFQNPKIFLPMRVNYSQSILTCMWLNAVGNCIIVGIALLTDSWRGLTFIVGLLSGVFIPTYWLLPRSPRWLLINGRKEEAMQILAVIAHRNKRKMPTEDIVVSSALQSTDKTIVQSLKHPKLRLYLTIAMMTW